MKKLFAITLFLVYSLSSTGMSISLHYCCGKLKSIDWTLPGQKNCEHQQKMGGKPCCETKLIGNKEKTDQELAALVLKPAPTTIVEITGFTDINIPHPEEKQIASTAFESPPLSALPLFIRYQVFRI